MFCSEKLSGICKSFARWVGLSRTTNLAIHFFFHLSLQELNPLFELFAGGQGIPRSRSNRGCAIFGLVSGVDSDFLERPAGLARTVGKVVAENMKGHVGDELPFFVASLTFELRPEVFNAPFGEVVRTPLLSQPSSALAGEDIHTLRITVIIVWFYWREVVVEGSPDHIVQIKCAGLAAFGIDQGNTASPLIDDTLIQTQCSDLDFMRSPAQ